METEPAEIPNPQLAQDATSESLDAPTARSFLAFHTTIRSRKASQGKEMISLIRSRKETEDKVNLVRNRINFITQELQAGEKSQKKENEKNDIKKRIRQQHADFKSEISERSREIELEKKLRDEVIKKNKEDHKRKIRQAKEVTIAKNKERRNSVRELEENIKITISQRVKEVSQLRKARVLAASQSIKMISHKRAASQETYRAGLQARQEARVIDEKTRKQQAEELLGQLEAQETSLMDKLKDSCNATYQMINNHSPRKPVNP